LKIQAEVTSKLDQSKAEIALKGGEIESLKSQLKSIQNDLHPKLFYQKELEELKASLENTENDWQNKLTEQLKIQAEVTSKLDQSKAEIALKGGEIESLKSQLKSIQNDLHPKLFYQKELEELKSSLENTEKDWQNKLTEQLKIKAEVTSKLDQSNAELALKEGKIESLKTQLKQNQALDLNQKYKKLRDVLVTKVFSSDSKNEELETLMNLDVLELFNKYEQIKNKAIFKIEDSTETLNDLKSKLKLQKEQRALYEKEHIEIMKALDINPNQRSYVDILPAIKELKNSLENSEEEHYTNAVDKMS